MLNQLFKKLGEFWANQQLEELVEIAQKANMLAHRSVIAGAEAQRVLREELDPERAKRNKSSILLALADFRQYRSFQSAHKAENNFHAVINGLLLVLSWRAPIYSAPATLPPLKKLITSVARATDGHKYAQLALKDLLTYFEQLLREWSALTLSMPIVEPDPEKAQKYRGAVYFKELEISTEMVDSAWKAAGQAARIKKLAESLASDREQLTAENTRAALVAVERDLNSRCAETIREITWGFYRVHWYASRFWNLERTGKILPQTVDDVARARKLLAESMNDACLNMHKAYQAEIAATERVKLLLTSFA